ncbi:uncharacterized protein RCO7_06806 [Rhynchosporium graminicola]|uniref:Uncharacterized protein n=1 Tax=Rhynchosporium graminicola TaxID=2792576 RepID=A0A1E1JY39_9HELO|nr:uncharacterized protein RCO7_06806 [Rhynchosporium commune]
MTKPTPTLGTAQGKDPVRHSTRPSYFFPACLHGFASEPSNELHRALDPAQSDSSYFRSGMAAKDAVRFSRRVGQGDGQETSPLHHVSCQLHFTPSDSYHLHQGYGPNAVMYISMAPLHERRSESSPPTIFSPTRRPVSRKGRNIIMTQEAVFGRARLQGSPYVLTASCWHFCYHTTEA